MELNNPREKGGVDFGKVTDLLDKSFYDIWSYKNSTSNRTILMHPNEEVIYDHLVLEHFNHYASNTTIDERNITMYTGPGGFNLFNQLIEENVSNTSIMHK